MAFPLLDAAFKLPAIDPPSLDAKAEAIQQAMVTAMKSLAKPSKPSKTEVPWWSPKCAEALAAVKAATTARLKGVAKRAFKATTRAARKAFYAEQVAEAAPDTIWSWAKRGLGIRPSPVPSLKKPDGTFTTTDEEKGALFHSTYFPPPPPLPSGRLRPLPPPPPPAPMASSPPPLLKSKLHFDHFQNS